jgi:hypothetical protein
MAKTFHGTIARRVSSQPALHARKVSNPQQIFIKKAVKQEDP